MTGCGMCVLFQRLESARAQLERERLALDDEVNVAKLETTTLREKCAALEVR